MSRILLASLATALLASSPAWSQLAAQGGMSAQHLPRRAPAPVAVQWGVPTPTPAPQNMAGAAPSPGRIDVGSYERPGVYPINPNPNVFAVSPKLNIHKVR